MIEWIYTPRWDKEEADRAYRAAVERDQILYQKIWGVIICFIGILIQLALGMLEAVIVTVLVLYIGFALLLTPKNLRLY